MQKQADTEACKIVQSISSLALVQKWVTLMFRLDECILILVFLIPNKKGILF